MILQEIDPEAFWKLVRRIVEEQFPDEAEALAVAKPEILRRLRGDEPEAASAPDFKHAFEFGTSEVQAVLGGLAVAWSAHATLRKLEVLDEATLKSDWLRHLSTEAGLERARVTEIVDRYGAELLRIAQSTPR